MWLCFSYHCFVYLVLEECVLWRGTLWLSNIITVHILFGAYFSHSVLCLGIRRAWVIVCLATDCQNGGLSQCLSTVPSGNAVHVEKPAAASSSFPGKDLSIYFRIQTWWQGWIVRSIWIFWVLLSFQWRYQSSWICRFVSVGHTVIYTALLLSCSYTISSWECCWIPTIHGF